MDTETQYRPAARVHLIMGAWDGASLTIADFQHIPKGATHDLYQVTSAESVLYVFHQVLAREDDNALHLRSLIGGDFWVTHDPYHGEPGRDWRIEWLPEGQPADQTHSLAALRGFSADALQKIGVEEWQRIKAAYNDAEAANDGQPPEWWGVALDAESFRRHLIDFIADDIERGRRPMDDLTPDEQELAAEMRGWVRVTD